MERYLRAVKASMGALVRDGSDGHGASSLERDGKRYIGALTLHCALLKAAKPYASNNGAYHFIRVCLGKAVSSATVPVVCLATGFVS